jgi:hypothetical protein
MLVNNCSNLTRAVVIRDRLVRLLEMEGGWVSRCCFPSSTASWVTTIIDLWLNGHTLKTCIAIMEGTLLGYSPRARLAVVIG